MAKRKKRRRRRRSKMIPVLIALLLIIVVGVVGIITNYIKRYTPSDSRMDLEEYYALENPEEAAIILQDRISESKGKIAEGEIYLPYRLVSGTLGGRFYWDGETQKMLYTTPQEILEIAPESNSYDVGGKTVEQDYPLIREMDGEYYLALDFLQQYMPIKAVTYENPARTVIFYQWQTETTVSAKNDSVIRYQGGIKSPILGEVKQGDTLLLLEELDNWSRVMTAEGLDGYVQKKDLTKPEETEYVYDGEYKEEYTSLTREDKINLAWHQVTSEAANAGLEQTLKQVKGVNVISPTWFSVTGNEGTISSLASEEYVKKAHGKGMEVWGLIDNFDKNISTLETLSSRSARTHIIQKLAEEAQRVDLDGINVDFERLTEEETPHFIQFIRELSVVCRRKGLVLSIDDPVPLFTGFYNRKEQGIMADYVIIMGYDEHVEGSEEAGSVASLPFVEEGIVQTLKEVPKEKVINGVPFYTRLWTESNNGTISSKVFGMEEAENYVKEQGLDVFWNTEVSQNYGEAVTDVGTVKIWLEDEESLDAKMKLIEQYELAGVAAWKLGFEKAAVWDVINKYVQ